MVEVVAELGELVGYFYVFAIVEGEQLSSDVFSKERLNVVFDGEFLIFLDFVESPDILVLV